MTNQRKDFVHKESRKLVRQYQPIVFEKLAPANMSRRPKPKKDEETGRYLPNGVAAKAGLNKSIRDVGWTQFVQRCQNKAEEAGSRVLLVSPNYTSQICSAYGAIQPNTLEERRSAGIPAVWDGVGSRPQLGHRHLAHWPQRGTYPCPAHQKIRARAEPSGDAPLRSPPAKAAGVVTMTLAKEKSEDL